ncbi:MAG TPA: hypothetical protein VM580_31235 [Labilithrix sp.]|nr:hypothetical protein [Labilithrix sp.]
MNAKTFSIGQALEFGVSTLKRNMGMSIGIGAASLGTMLIVNGLAETAQDHAVLVMGFGLVSQLVQVFWSLVWIRFALSAYDAQVLRPRELVPDSKLYLEYLAVSLLYGLVVIAGLFLLIIPGIYLAVRYGLVGFLVADGRSDVLSSFPKSAALTRGVRWRLFLFMVVVTLLNFVGVMFFGIGLFFTVPISMFAMALVYRRLAIQAESERPPIVAPPSPQPA